MYRFLSFLSVTALSLGLMVAFMPACGDECTKAGECLEGEVCHKGLCTKASANYVKCESNLECDRTGNYKCVAGRCVVGTQVIIPDAGMPDLGAADMGGGSPDLGGGSPDMGGGAADTAMPDSNVDDLGGGDEDAGDPDAGMVD